MIYRHLLILIIAVFALNTAYGQSPTVKGTVRDSKTKSTLPGASVYWAGTTIGTTTDAQGKFEITADSLPAVLVVTFIGYTNDSLLIAKSANIVIELRQGTALASVDIDARSEATAISTINPLNVEKVTSKELLKAACCNLSESFETNPSINVSFSDAITGAKEIQMLGLSGIYSQIMTENIPAVRGLASTYGLNYIPGPWMESIQITKGSGSVANGFESTTGQINVEFIKPDQAEPFYLNLYGASTGNTELNTYTSLNESKELKGVLFLHGEMSPVEWDKQDDGFLDLPLVKQGNVYNRWTFHNPQHNIEGQFGVKGLIENRKSGQTAFLDDRTNHYGVEIDTRRIEAYSKTGKVFPETPWKSAGLILSGSYHNQESFFGLKTYEGSQTSFYGSMIFMSIINTTDHKWKTGLDFRYDNYDEVYNLNPYLKEEIVPGAYLEYTYSFKEKFTAVAGIRADHHNTFEWFTTPRLHMKYNFTPDIIIRGGIGNSFRTANVFAENAGIMASSRELVIAEALRPERAWNYGLNLTTRFKLDYRPGNLSIDYYITDFTNQVVVDPYSNQDQILFYNLKGNSSSKSFQIAMNYELLKRLDLRLAYKLDDVFVDYISGSSRKPMVARQRGLVNIAYATIKDKWKFDFTTIIEGEKKLGLSNTGQPYSDSQVRNNIAPAFTTINVQITRKVKKWDFYAGAENLTDFTQNVPVFGYDDPFGPEFDATGVWGPVFGRKLYIGLRYTINKEKKTTNNENDN